MTATYTLAIDAMGSLVDGLKGRLGENEPSLRDALAQIRMAYVQFEAATRTPETARGSNGPASRGNGEVAP